MADSRRFGPFTRFKFQNRTKDTDVDAKLRLLRRGQPTYEDPPVDEPTVPRGGEHENVDIVQPDIVEAKVTTEMPWREVILAVDDVKLEDIQEVEATFEWDTDVRRNRLEVLIRYADGTKEKTDRKTNP